MSSVRNTQQKGSGRQQHTRTASEQSGLVSRRAWIGAAAGGAVLLVLGRRVWSGQASAEGLAAITVYKDPNCGCCSKWVAHMRDAGFTLTERNTTDMATVKRERKVPEGLHSCHTSVVDGYVFEGHVPADLVAKVLRERPALLGLAVPGMPQSAPGMDIGHERYEVHSFTKAGETAVYDVRS